MSTLDVVVVPANESSCADLQTIFGQRGQGYRCQCQRYKLAPRESFASFPVEERVQRLREQRNDGTLRRHNGGVVDATTSESRPGWLLDELKTVGRENLDPDHVRNYDSKEDAAADQEVRLLQSRGLDEGSTVVDMGAGTGQFALAVAPYCARVVAVDVSPVMLEALGTSVEEAANTSNVEVVRAGFLTYEHHGPPADVVYSRYALHHLPDFWKALALERIHRLMRPGGILRLWDVVYNFGPAEAEERIEAWCATEFGDGDGSWHREDLEEHVRDEHSTFTWLLEPMLQHAGFTIEEASYTPDGIFAQYIARAGIH